MIKPKNTTIEVFVADDGQTVAVKIHSSNTEAIRKFYEKLESLLMEALRIDLEDDWQQDD